jgi:hypothetical protein
VEAQHANALDQAIDRLGGRFPAMSREDITAVVMAIYQEYDACKVRGYLPILVERQARDRLEHASSAAATTAVSPLAG